MTELDPAVGAPQARVPRSPSGAARALRPRAETVRRREAIVRAAMITFAAKGYYHGSLAEVAEQVGMTHAGVLHHFGSKDQLLLEVLKARDETDVEHLEGHHPPQGAGFFTHLVKTARLNMGRRGIVQTYAVLSAESVTEDHPGQEWFRTRYETLRGQIIDALHLMADPEHPPAPEQVQHAAGAIPAVMDGLQLQWLLDPDALDLADATRFAIEAILRSVLGPTVDLPSGVL